MISVDHRYAEASPPCVIDRRYHIKREIGRGGMGVVFEAEHAVTRATLALKTLTIEALGMPSVQTRLLREARALSLAKHDGVVGVLDAGICREFGPFIALEMVEGRSLESFIIARSGLDVETTVGVAMQIGEALSFVHSRGVVHRDIKPANVIVTREAGREGDVIKLIDFGIAAVQQSEDVTDRKITRVTETLGTFEYMAPEQLLHGVSASPASDVYAFGALLYECLAGDVPFPGNHTMVTATLAAGRRAPPLRAHRPEIPPELDAAIARALSRLPEERFSSPRALAEACSAALGRPARPIALLDPTAAGSAPSRRRFVRAAFVTPVRIATVQGLRDGRTEDISEGGILAITTALCGEGERVRVRLPLPMTGRVVNVDAIGRWARTRRGQRALGLEFVDLPDDVRADIRRYVDFMAGEVGEDSLVTGGR